MGGGRLCGWLGRQLPGRPHLRPARLRVVFHHRDGRPGRHLRGPGRALVGQELEGEGPGGEEGGGRRRGANNNKEMVY